MTWGSETPVVAVLYCEKDGVYSTFNYLDLWGVDRNAILYQGPYPVVAHPPCNRWSIMALCNKHKPGCEIGNDGGTFASALDNLREHGGVLEHPAGSLAWDYFGLQKPQLKFAWEKTIFGYWVIHINQSAFGHKATKPTWLIYYSPYDNKPELINADFTIEGDTLLSAYPNSRMKGRINTPRTLAKYLIDLARHAVHI